MASQPQVLIADEPTTSLDVTTQAQYLRLLKELQERHAFAMLFVTHDLGIVAKICDRVAVMYAGRIVETALMRELFNSPVHPYTKALIQSVPKLSDRRERLAAIDGHPPNPATLPPGCAFHPRCTDATRRCREEAPVDTHIAPHHTVRCWLWSTP